MLVPEDQVLVNPSEIMTGLIEMSSSEASINERLVEARAAITKVALMDDTPHAVMEQVAVVAHKLRYIEDVMQSLVFFTNKTLGEFMPDKD